MISNEGDIYFKIINLLPFKNMMFNLKIVVDTMRQAADGHGVKPSN